MSDNEYALSMARSRGNRKKHDGRIVAAAAINYGNLRSPICDKVKCGISNLRILCNRESV